MTTKRGIVKLARRVVKRSLQTAMLGAIRLGILPRVTILKVDGGICSQIHFMAVAKILQSRGQRVVLDLDWFEDNGLDLDGRFARIYEYGILYPADALEIWPRGLRKTLYRLSFWCRNDYFDAARAFDWIERKGPLYYEGYFPEPSEMFGDNFQRWFGTPMPPADIDRQALESIQAAGRRSCGVHVRRGDLARAVPPYGEPAGVDYFVAAIRAVMAVQPDAIIFFFSDEPSWVEAEIFPALYRLSDARNEFHMISRPDSRGGASDLYMMSRCHHVVTSQGSMGKYASLMRPDKLRGGLVTLRPGSDSDEWLARIPSARIIG